MPKSFLGSNVIWSELKCDSILDLGRVRSWTQVWFGAGLGSGVLDPGVVWCWARVEFGPGPRCDWVSDPGRTPVRLSPGANM